VKIAATPSRLSATTRKPDTAPPWRAVVIASSTLRRAALAARAFALTATVIPMEPANPDAVAPTRNARAALRPRSASPSTAPIRPPIRAATTRARRAIVAYCRLR
jgi:hypothetical protein